VGFILLKIYVKNAIAEPYQRIRRGFHHKIDMVNIEESSKKLNKGV